MAQVALVRAEQPRVGTRKLQIHLAEAGVPVGRDQLFTWLRDDDALVKRKRRGTFTTYSRHGYAVAPNRLKDALITGPGQAVVSDITYLRLERDRFAYLFLVSDVYARQIVGWHLSQDLSHHSALLALQHAVRTIGAVDGVLHHSDRGSQYCCHEYLRSLATVHMLPSMTDANHCYQNAIAERDQWHPERRIQPRHRLPILHGRPPRSRTKRPLLQHGPPARKPRHADPRPRVLPRSLGRKKPSLTCVDIS
jgi:transposase InsO family protein